MANKVSLGMTGHSRYQTNQKHRTNINQIIRIAFNYLKKSRKMKKHTQSQTAIIT